MLWGALVALAALSRAVVASDLHPPQSGSGVCVDVNETTDFPELAGEGEGEGEGVGEGVGEGEGVGALSRGAGAARAAALLLYTEYQARAATAMKQFIANVTRLKHDTIFGSLEPGILDKAPPSCREQFMSSLSRAVYNAQRAATFTGENHHKFFLGHMIVFRMHLNKAEDYIKKCNHVLKTCGPNCENTGKVRRWRSLAAEELCRVRADVRRSRAAYRDLLAHAHRRLRALRRRADQAAGDAVAHFHHCLGQPAAAAAAAAKL